MTDLHSLVEQLKNALSEHGDSNVIWEVLQKLSEKLLKEIHQSNVTLEYCNVLKLLLNALKPPLIKTKEREKLFDSFFLNGSYHDSFIIIMKHLNSTSPSYAQTKILDLLEKFLRNGNLYSLFLSQCYLEEEEQLKNIGKSMYWNELITMLALFPEKIANKASHERRNIFTSGCYVPLMASSIWKVLCKVYEYIQSGKICNIDFLGQVTGRLCNVGHGPQVTKYLCTQFLKGSQSDFLWRAISANFVSKIPAAAMETFLASVFICIPWFGYVEYLLGDIVLSDQKTQFLMTVKFLLLRQFKDVILLQNIIGYLVSRPERRGLFYKVLSTLLNVWSDQSALKHQSTIQQQYLASAIIICGAHLKELPASDTNKDFMQKALDGVQGRIGSPDAVVRSMGMMVGEFLVSAIDPEAPKLKFEHDFTIPEIKQLDNLKVVPKKPEIETNDKDVLEIESLLFLHEEVEISERKEQEDSDADLANNLREKSAEDLDSDDDLEPYDMSHDVPLESKNRPLYLRDCLEGLIEAEKPEWTEQCLLHAPDLIRKNPDEAPKIAVEMAKVFLHMDDTFGMSDFAPSRHRALIAITTQCPVEVAPYLTHEFYEREYNIRQRLDILEVVAASSLALSKIEMKDIEEVKETKPIKDSEESWQRIIDKRLEAKTRRISLGPRRRVAEPQMNLFGSVAGHFFFPLLEKFDRGNETLNMMGEDSYVLGRLLYTLGIVIYSSANTMICRQMGCSLLKFLSAVRNHNEIFVRRSAIFAATTIFLSVPPFYLLSELQNEVLDCQMWLKSVVDDDCDVDCQVRAAQATQLLLNNIEQELPMIGNKIFSC